MDDDEQYSWFATMMLLVAVCERVELLAHDEAPESLRTPIVTHAEQLRDLASTEIQRLRT